ncbi:TPA: hypothetical protein SK282_000248 [Yersinia enterocolitica]|nr:hypothetical protein [Yersinia enterocolitica]
MDKSILQQINHWAACARLTSECSSVVHADLLEKVASHIISIESLQEETQKERDDLKELNCHFDLSIRKTEGISEVLRSKLEAAERALIKPLPIGELVHRLEGQTYEKWFSESDVKDLLERAQKAEAALSAANEKLSKPVVLPDYRCSPDMHTKQYYETIGFNLGLDACKAVIKTAGFTVEGNADAE